MSATGNTHITTHAQAYRCTSGVETRISNQFDSTHTYIHSLAFFLFPFHFRETIIISNVRQAGCVWLPSGGCKWLCYCLLPSSHGYRHRTSVFEVEEGEKARDKLGRSFQFPRLEKYWSLLKNSRASISPHCHLIVEHLKKGGSSQV